jgi:hypothetical protein
MIQRYANIWHNGRVPDGNARVQFIVRVLEEYLPERDRQFAGAFTEADWIKERDITAGYLAEARDCVARQQNSRWEN